MSSACYDSSGGCTKRELIGNIRITVNEPFTWFNIKNKWLISLTFGNFTNISHILTVKDITRFLSAINIGLGYVSYNSAKFWLSC